MARVLILTGDAAEELDSMYPVFRLREGGHAAIVAAPTTRAVKLVVHDFEPGWDAYTEKPGHQLPVDLAFADVHPEDFDGLVIPGGRAPEYLRTNPDVARIVRHFFENGLPVGTICHGPQVPAALGTAARPHHGRLPAPEGRHGARGRHLRGRAGRGGRRHGVLPRLARPAAVVPRLPAGAGEVERSGVTNAMKAPFLSLSVLKGAFMAFSGPRVARSG